MEALTIEKQDNTPGAHTLQPSPRPRQQLLDVEAPTLEELHDRHVAARDAVREWLQDWLVAAPYDPSLGEFQVRVSLKPDVVSAPEGGYSEDEVAAFSRREWWFKTASVEIWMVPDTEHGRTKADAVRVAKAMKVACPEGNVSPDRFIPAWEGEYSWMDLLRAAVDAANETLALLKSGYLLSAEPTDPENPTEQPTPGAGFATTLSGGS